MAFRGDPKKSQRKGSNSPSNRIKVISADKARRSFSSSSSSSSSSSNFEDVELKKMMHDNEKSSSPKMPSFYINSEEEEELSSISSSDDTHDDDDDEKDDENLQIVDDDDEASNYGENYLDDSHPIMVTIARSMRSFRESTDVRYDDDDDDGDDDVVDAKSDTDEYEKKPLFVRFFRHFLLRIVVMLIIMQINIVVYFLDPTSYANVESSIPGLGDNNFRI